MAFLKTTSGQWTLLVGIVLFSAVMMYFTFSNGEGFAGQGTHLSVRLQKFKDEDGVFPHSKSNKHWSAYDRVAAF